MADELIDFLTLDGELPAAETRQEPTTEQPAPSEAPAPAEQITAPEPVTPVAPPSPGFVPLSAVLDEREKRQALERQLQELQRKQQPAPVAPDVTSDPKGWQAAQDARYQKYEMDTKMQMSGRFAAAHYGQDKVTAAMEWGRQQNSDDNFFGSKFTAQSDPYGWLVEQHRQAQALGMLGNKTPEDWALEYAVAQGFVKPDVTQSQQQPAAAQAPVSQAAQQRPAPPRSIVNAPPAGGTNTQVTLSEKELMDGIFK